MAGNKNSGRRNHGRPNATRTGVILENDVLTYLKGRGTNVSAAIEKIVRIEMEKKQAVFERLANLGFSPAEIEAIAEWWNLYTSAEHYDWVLSSDKAEIASASAEALFSYMADKIYSQVYDVDDKQHRQAKLVEIEGWLMDGQDALTTPLDTLIAEWREYDE